ncbi:MAG: recombination-associated protein RdgC [Candidatus Accumulibacter sp.]|jgi:recombination associated protein RdgC|nr:recombination-associated protein RdgC [Accumulibacter sp.]
MWFKNLQLFRLPAPDEVTLEALEARLARHPLQPCGSLDGSSAGWIPPGEDGALVHAVDRQWLIALGVEQRLLPISIVKQHVADRVKNIEENEGRSVGRRELREIFEATSEELLPRAFVARRTTPAWIDPVHGWLAIDAAAPSKADELIEQLRRAADRLTIAPVKTMRSPAAAMTGWVAGGEPPAGFTIDLDLELRSAENAVVRYTRHPLDGEEIPRHIAAGKTVTRLGLTWGDKISFVLDDEMRLRRLDFLDILKDSAEGQAENEAERLDLDFALMTGELARLFDDLIAALGGERPTERR